MLAEEGIEKILWSANEVHGKMNNVEFVAGQTKT
jgi:hypothetical protein